MKALVWSSFFVPDLGGVETLLSKLLPLFREKGVEPAVVTSHGPARMPDESEYEGIPVYRFNFREAIEQQQPATMLRLVRAVGELKQRLSPDLIHIHFSDPSIFFHLETRRFHDVPTVASFHQDYRFYGIEPVTRSLLQKTVDAASWTTAVSRKTMEGALEFAGPRSDRVSLIYNGVSGAGRLSVTPPKTDPLTILCLGRLVVQKRLDFAIEAFATIADRHPRSRLLIAGDGPLRQELVQQAARLGLDSRVEFLGRVEPDRVPELMSASTVVALSSQVEAFPMVLLEAGACARPVVATDVGGVSEAIVDGQTGLLVPPGDPEALSDAISGLLADPDRCLAMGLAARERILSEFTLEAAADAYIRLFRNVIEEASLARSTGT